MPHTNNNELKTIKQNWPGTPIDEGGRFVNHEYPFVPKTADVFKWMFSKNPQKQQKKEDQFRLQRIEDASFLQHQQDCIVWLGHASFFIRLANMQLLIDPVFFDVPIVKRYARHEYSPAVFDSLHYLLISHDHQDHCQQKSIRAIVQHNKNFEILTGLNMDGLLKPWTNNVPIQMAGWYQQYNTPSAISIYYLPSRHWSKRSIEDENKRLWGAFVIQSKNKTIYFSGDSGYGNHFSSAQELFPSIDVAIMGIGAYKPEWFMHPNHMSPQDAVKAFHDLKAETLIPMHYGTFDVSDEPVGEPLRVLEALRDENKINGSLKALHLGEAYHI